MRPPFNSRGHLVDATAQALRAVVVAVEMLARGLLGGGLVRSGIGEALHRRNCQVYDAWRAKDFIA